MARPTAASETSSRILDVAERLVQMRGFNAFSYADVAEALRVTKASLHYHFATKAELGARLIDRYRTSFLTLLERIDESRCEAGAKLGAYVGIYIDVLEHDRLCLCGMLAAEYTTLPAAMQEGVRQFFDDNEAWLVHVLTRGREKSSLRLPDRRSKPHGFWFRPWKARCFWRARVVIPLSCNRFASVCWSIWGEVEGTGGVARA